MLNHVQAAHAQVTKLHIEGVDFFLRNVRLRLPFRYGNACLVAAPLLHTRLRARGEDGGAVTGVCADMLPPKWFDKAADRTFRDNIRDLISAAHIGRQQYQEAFAEPAGVFAHWHRAYPRVRQAAQEAGLNGLTASFGSSIIERALIDAACKLAETDFYSMVVSNGLGVVPGAVHPELEAVDWASAWPSAPLSQVHVRHTIGLGDPLTDADLAPGQRLDDGLPQTLEAWMREAGVRFLKIKVQGKIEQDLDRLRRIVAVAGGCAAGGYRVTLDGNEQFHTAAALRDWLRRLSEDAVWEQLRDRVMFVEQPLDRGVALAHPLEDLGAAPWPPMIIDESDDHTDALKQAVRQGYRGTSVKNCKGVLHAILNKLLIDHFNREQPGGGYLLSSEDLCNQPLIPLQQDLCTLSVLGVTHAERNGHHYAGTLDHVPAKELEAALAQHPDLYLRHASSARLHIEDGRLSLGSLRQPGYGTAVEPDWSSMPPAEDWAFASLGIEEG